MNYRKQWEEEKPKCQKCGGYTYIDDYRECNNCDDVGVVKYEHLLESKLTKAIETLEKGKEYCEDYDPHYEDNELWSILANAVYELKGGSQ